MNMWVNRLRKWKERRGIRGELFQLDKQKLDELLQLFYAEIRKEDSTEYKPDSLHVMLAALDYHFKENGADYSLLKDSFPESTFERSRLVNGMAIELRESGKGKRKNKADPLTLEEEELLWCSDALGVQSPESLNCALFYTLSQHFGTRGVQEHLQMRRMREVSGAGDTERRKRENL